jgi:hypothetical protein
LLRSSGVGDAWFARAQWKVRRPSLMEISDGIGSRL